MRHGEFEEHEDETSPDSKLFKITRGLPIQQGNLPDAAASNHPHHPGVEGVPHYHFVCLTEVELDSSVSATSKK